MKHKAKTVKPLPVDQSIQSANKRSMTQNRNRCLQRTYTYTPYKRLRYLAEAAGISIPCAHKRLARGWSVGEVRWGRLKQKILRDNRNIIPRGKPVYVGGTLYPSFNAAYEAIKPPCKLNAVHARLRYGYSPEEALGVVHRSDGRTTRCAN